MNAHQQHFAEERRAMQFIAGTVAFGFACIVILAVAAYADQLAGLDFVARAIAMLGSL